MFARHAIRTGNLKTTIMSIDPKPRAEIDSLCDRVMRLPLELCDLNLFRELEPGDILFFDGSHRIFANSDVTVFFIEVLPRLKPGVLVHVHDIFLPADYLRLGTGVSIASNIFWRQCCFVQRLLSEYCCRTISFPPTLRAARVFGRFSKERAVNAIFRFSTIMMLRRQEFRFGLKLCL